MWAKIITIKRTKALTTSVCVHWIYLIHKFHNLNWITETNELFHDILIYWDASVQYIGVSKLIVSTVHRDADEDASLLVQ